MDNLQILQKDPIWIKSCELTRSLLIIAKMASRCGAGEETEKLLSSLGGLPVAIGRAITAANSREQVFFYNSALAKARAVEKNLHAVFGIMQNSKILKQKSTVIGRLFTAFYIGDQLREMILNFLNEIEALNKAKISI